MLVCIMYTAESRLCFRGHFYSFRSDSLKDVLFSMRTNYHSSWSRHSRGVWDLQVHISHTVVQRAALLPHSSRVAGLILSSGYCLCGVCFHLGFLPLSKYMLELKVWKSACAMASHPGCIWTSCPVFLGQTEAGSTVVLMWIKRLLKKHDCLHTLLEILIVCCYGFICMAYSCTPVKERDLSCDQHVWPEQHSNLYLQYLSTFKYKTHSIIQYT